MTMILNLLLTHQQIFFIGFFKNKSIFNNLLDMQTVNQAFDGDSEKLNFDDLFLFFS